MLKKMKKERDCETYLERVKKKKDPGEEVPWGDGG
jgi:hypothetical protein